MQRVQKRKRRFQRMVLAILSITFLAVITIVAYLFIQYFNPFIAGGAQAMSGIKTIVVENTADSPHYDLIQKEEEDIHKGNLILVNRDLPCTFSDMEQLVRLSDYTSGSYQISNTEMLIHRDAVESLNAMLDEFTSLTGFEDLLVASTYRSYELQEELYAQEEDPDSIWVAPPGHSEHHTGYALDFSIYTKMGVSFDYTGAGTCSWINQNCWKYGFIVRYTQEKQDITRYGNEPWHFRYVGEPHAYLIRGMGLCMEEYLSTLKQYRFGDRHLQIELPDREVFEIYYVPAEENNFEIPVPTDREYEISGDNQNGFIVTVHC